MIEMRSNMYTITLSVTGLIISLERQRTIVWGIFKF